MSVVVTVGVLSALLTTTPAPATTPNMSSSTSAHTTPLVTDTRDPWIPVAAGAVVVGGALVAGGTVVAIGQQSVIADASANGDDRLRAQQQLPVAVGVAVVGGVVVVGGIAVAVWRALTADEAAR